jgi:hypothetical protein
MIVQVGLNCNLHIVTVAIVAKLPTNRYLYLVIGVIGNVVKTFYITNKYKAREKYNCKKLPNKCHVENVDVERMTKLIQINYVQ